MSAKRRIFLPALFFAILVSALVLGFGVARARATTAPVPAPAAQAQPPAVGLSQITYNTVITVTSALDPNNSLTQTCYNELEASQSATAPCTLRRALVEANSSGIPRPILIRFAVPRSDEGYLPDVDAWQINIIDELPIIGRDGGQVTIDGTTQPDGRDDGPRIIVNGRTFQVGVGVLNADENIIRGLAFQNADIQVGSNNNLIEDNWLGLSADGQRPYQITDDPRSVGNAAIDVNNSNGNTIRNNVVTSGNGIDIQGTGNTVVGNYVGTRPDGTIPEIPANRFCQQGAVFDTWRGGGGIEVTGGNNQIGGPTDAERNVLVGLLIQGGPLNPAIAFYSGSNNIAQNNYIGRDANGNDVGTCSVGIRAEGEGLQLVNNVIVGTGAEAISAVSDRFVNDNISWRGNVIIDPADKDGVFFNQNVPDALRFFESAIITSIDGTTVEGTSAPGSDCPECTIEVFLDNNDDVIETLESLAVTTADADGNWTATITETLGPNEGLRTSSTTNDFNVIEGFAANTSADFSEDVYNEAGVITPTVRPDPVIEPRPPQEYDLFPEPRPVPDLPQINPTSVITVETSEDLSGAISATCLSESICTLRRALRQASEAPANERPILVRFNLDTSDPGYDADTDTWLFEVTSSGTDGTLEVEGGGVIIDGTTQPGGRTDGPPIVINGSPLAIGGTLPSEGYIVRGLLLLNNNLTVNGSRTFIVDNWFGLNPDGQSIYFPGDGTPNASQRSGVRLTNRASEVVVRNNRFAGSGGIALDIESSDSFIADNYIGTRADGSVPTPPDAELRCNQNPASGNWFGGSGIQMSGSRNQLTNNVLAGLLQIGIEIGPTAINMSGAQHLLFNNRIGVDANGTPSYACGFGVQVDGEFSRVISNTISNLDSKAFFIGGEGNFGIELQGNRVSDVDGYVEYGVQVPTAFVVFNAAQITSVNGTTVEGTSGAGSPCPYCTVEVFLEDDDTERETLESLAVTTADADGNWTATLSRAIDTAAGERLRTMSTLNDLNIVAGFEAGTTVPSPSSTLYPVVALEGLTVAGPTAGEVGVTYTYTATILPANAGRPVEVSAAFEEVGSAFNTLDGTADSVAYTASWDEPGVKTLVFTATNEVSTITETLDVTIGSPGSGSSTPVDPGAPTTFEPAPGVIVNFPAGSTAQRIIVTYSDQSERTPPADFLVLRRIVLTAEDEAGQPVSSATAPFGVSFTIEDTELPAGTTASNVQVYYWNGSTWVLVTELTRPVLAAALNFGFDTTQFTEFVAGVPQTEPGGGSETLYLPLVQR